MQFQTAIVGRCIAGRFHGLREKEVQTDGPATPNSVIVLDTTVGIVGGTIIHTAWRHGILMYEEYWPV